MPKLASGQTPALSPSRSAWMLVTLPGRAVARALGGFLPSSLPYLSRRAYSLEMTSTLFFTLALAMIDGGVIAVFAKQSFSADVEQARLNIAVALLGSMAELANILSFVWIGLSQGRAKVRLINALQVVMIAAIAAIALVPTNTQSGLTLLLALVLVARLCWSGILTLRPTVWRANYPRHVRAKIVGRLSTVQVIVGAVAGAALGWTLDRDPSLYRVFIPVAACVALLAVVFYAKLRVRGEKRLLREEVASGVEPAFKPWRGPVTVWQVLRQDRWYALFMLWMFVLGWGNLMVLPVLVATLKEEFQQDYFHSILIASTIPQLVMPLAIPLWARLLDRAHVVRFRALHGWTFVIAGACFVAGAALHSLPLFYLGAIVQGLGFAGGSLAWNLGHVDFAVPSQTSKYMATHVTLNGVRGLLAPLFAISVYELAKSAGMHAHTWVQSLSLVISIAGVLGFVHLRHAMGKLAEQHART